MPAKKTKRKVTRKKVVMEKNPFLQRVMSGMVEILKPYKK
jgi:hypothetical protein|tara:strand:+ start:81 stop:200 length:120 start_codon:yes stop_codon:yes gene_type:complete